MRWTRRTRRRVDALVAAALGVIVLVVALIIWRGSDFRATALDRAQPSSAPIAAAEAPTTLAQKWELPTDPTYGAIASPYGTVITADAHTVTGHDATTGAVRWSYARTNVSLCAIGSGDTEATDLSTWAGVRGILTVYAEHGWCSQVTLLDPITGERLYQRTSPGDEDGQLAFGGPYAAWMGHDLLELWRHDLFRTIQYGNQPNPVNADGPHTGCTFSDIALADQQFATVEHCPTKSSDTNSSDTNSSDTNSSDARVVLNWATPSDAPGDHHWDAMHTQPRADIETGSPDARIVGITPDRVAVLVSTPSPAVVVYDASGNETSRSPVDISAAEIVDAARAGITPSVTFGDRRLTLVGNHLLSVSVKSVQAPAPPTTASVVTSTITGVAHPSSSGQSSSQSAAASSAAAATVSVDDPELDWVASGARGLATLAGDTVLMPTDGGLAALDATTGSIRSTIPVDRHGFTGRVDVAEVGTMIVETRNGTVVGLS